MDNQINLSLPFLTRKMLAFEFATKFQLRIKCRNVVSGDILIRGSTRDGAFTLRHTTRTDGLETEEFFNITDIPIWVSVSSSSSANQRGQTYVTVDLQINEVNILQLLSGYIWDQFTLSWPIANLKEPSPEWGEIIDMSGANPAAGAEVSIAVPSNQIWRVHAVGFQLVTDGNVANRRVHLRFEFGSGEAIECLSNVDQTASLTRNYSCYPNASGGASSDDNDIIIPISPKIILLPNETIKTVTTNKQATDNYGVPVARVERFITTKT